MAAINKAVFDIELDDSKFKAFAEKYQQYKKSLDDLPEQWQKINDQAKVTAEQQVQMSALLTSHLDAMARIRAAHEEELNGAGVLAASWEGLHKYSALFTRHITDSTLSLAKWTGLTAVFSSILGAGGLFGIDRMAAGVSSLRNTAAGYNNTVGEQQSFETAFARLGDTGTNLDWVNDLTHDAGKIGYIQAITGSVGEATRISREDAGAAFSELLPYLKQHADQWKKEGNLHNLSQAYGVPEDLMVELSNMSPDEVRKMIEDYRQNLNPLSLPKDVLKKWNDLTSGFQLAGGTVLTAFENQLVKLTPGVKDLATAFGKVIDSTMRDGGPFDDAMKTIGTGLGQFADTLSKGSWGSFGQNVEALTKVVEQIIASPWDSAAGALGNIAADEFGKVVQDFKDPTKTIAQKAEAAAVDAAKGAAAGIGAAAIKGAQAISKIPGALNHLYGYDKVRTGSPLPVNGKVKPSPPPKDEGWFPHLLRTGGPLDFTSPRTAETKGKPVAQSIMDTYGNTPMSKASRALAPHPNHAYWNAQTMKPKISIMVPQGNAVTSN